jgi:hypothetical protein
MESIAGGLTLVSATVSLLLLVQTIRKMLKESPISRLAPIVAIGATLFTTALYVALTGASVNPQLALPLLGVGLLVGLGEAQLTRLTYRGNTLIVKRSVGYLALWGLAYLLTMGLAQLGSGALHALGILTMVFGAGIALGSNLALLVKQLRVRRAPADEPSPNLATHPTRALQARRTRYPVVIALSVAGLWFVLLALMGGLLLLLPGQAP